MSDCQFSLGRVVDAEAIQIAVGCEVTANGPVAGFHVTGDDGNVLPLGFAFGKLPSDGFGDLEAFCDENHSGDIAIQTMHAERLSLGVGVLKPPFDA